MLDQSLDQSVLPLAGDGRAGPVVQHLREVLLWPLRLMPQGDDEDEVPPWQRLRDLGDGSPWREHVDEYTGDPSQFHERHYNEFVTFLPYVQRFLYGEGRVAREKGDPAEEGSPMRVFRRSDVARVRVWLDADGEPIELRVVHVDLYFFFDVDVVLLNVEFEADALPLNVAQELLYRTGRAYPPGWDAAGRPRHCLQGAEWLAADGSVLARSDGHARELFLAHVAKHRSPRIAAHWAWLLEPLVPDHSGEAGALRYRQIEYYRMPMMAYLALDDPSALTRADFIRLGLMTGSDATRAGARAETSMPYAEHHLSDFEKSYCYDRFWSPGGDAPYTRYLCSGRSLVVVGRADAQFFRCPDRGVLAQFRHPHFMLFLIAHFQKAALLMFSDRLVEALKRLNVKDANSVKRFKRELRSCFEGFLRFTHRYWFHEVAEQAQVRALFQLLVGHLRVDTLYADVKQRIADMNDYLDADSLRRQANTVVRLTVVTMFGLIGTVTTGFLGMNLLSEADAPLSRRFWFFTGVFLLTTALTFYTIAKSKRLSDFLDVLSDERVSLWQKAKVWAGVWGREKD